ncbi:winged helix-turn-helix transcriptional regulator [Mucilaginibacter flavus]|uniref:winged helix-turn-helix transcriptional regulator n=1 Tax=Mucilaginibacter flavus TaxID=931504 RepID=UPI0025B53146|nr:helix-turn-helix domain-containing protein [Mucilaginibacter flavus]MDN3581786.1 helix-turn-helix domain-containing protein [Mucilaginibacter flavus]
MALNQFRHCGLNVTLNMLAGKWKPVILFYLFHNEKMRFTELWRVIPKVAKKVLLDQLKDMELNQLVIREEKHTFPPEVYYKLSDRGKALGPALAALEDWANLYAAAEVAEVKRLTKPVIGLEQK